MSPFFSIIVPVYKVERYLEQCVSSIRNQTCTDFELILVDDGSPDGCPFLCDAYAKEDSRIQVLHKKNEGLVRARQDGLLRASGQYIVNVDSDDWIAEDMLQNAREILKNGAVDMISFSFSWEYGAYSRKDEEPVPEGAYHRREIETVIWPRVLMEKDMSHVHSNLWGKVIRKSLLLKHQLAVEPGITLGEDLLCTVPLYAEAKSVYISRKTAYFYRQREESMTKVVEFSDSRREQRLLEALERADYRTKDHFEEQLDRYAVAQCFWMMTELVRHRERAQLENFQRYISQPVFQTHMKRAVFSGLTKKTQIAAALIRRNKVKEAYYFLVLCRKIKGKGGAVL